MTCNLVLEVDNLATHFFTRKGVIRAVAGISFSLARGKTLGLVGESGCGKSVTALSLMRLVEPPGKIISGEVRFNGTDLFRLTKEKLRQVRGREMALVSQDPLSSLNPVLSVGRQLVETILSHEATTPAIARQRSVEQLARLGLPDPERLLGQYPFQLSGGMRQRVLLAMALSMGPKVLIADEPTTALDVTIQAQILAELKRLQGEMQMAVLLISHDLGVVSALAEEIAVMYAGSIVEHGPAERILRYPAHPYTQALLRSVPRLDKKNLFPVEGQPPNPLHIPAYCPFCPRCTQAGPECREANPALRQVAPGHAVACHRSLPAYGEGEKGR